MKKLAVTLFSLFAFGALSFAQDEAELSKWMKAIQTETGVLRKADPKTGADVAASAEKVAVLYDQTKGFWEKRQMADAVKMSDEGKAAAMELASAAKASDGEKANAAFKTLGGTCRGCHDLHREKAADGSYKIK